MRSVRPFDEVARAETREWLESWARRGPVLEARRVAELRQLTEAESARIAVDVIWPMVPSGGGDDGQGLRAMYDVLQRLAGRG